MTLPGNRRESMSHFSWRQTKLWTMETLRIRRFLNSMSMPLVGRCLYVMQTLCTLSGITQIRRYAMNNAFC